MNIPPFYASALDMILEIVEKRTAVVTTLAITGPDCAGKSTLSKWLRDELLERNYSVSTIEVDSYIRPRESRTGLPTEAEYYYLNDFDLEQLIRDLERTKNDILALENSSKSNINFVEGVFLLKTELIPN